MLNMNGYENKSQRGKKCLKQSKITKNLLFVLPITGSSMNGLISSLPLKFALCHQEFLLLLVCAKFTVMKQTLDKA